MRHQLQTRLVALIGIASSSAALILLSCSEATDGLVPPNRVESEAGGESSAASSTSSTSSSSGSSGANRDATTTSSSPILLNEIAGDKEWIEIVNSGSQAIDLSGWRVADVNKDTGEPKLEEAATIPNGTSLAASDYGMILGGGLDAGKSCPTGGQKFCVLAEFGISTKNGETIFLVDKSGAVVGQVVYPPDAAAPDRSWSRLPNADPQGTFRLTTATPGGPNL